MRAFFIRGGATAEICVARAPSVAVFTFAACWGRFAVRSGAVVKAAAGTGASDARLKTEAQRVAAGAVAPESSSAAAVTGGDGAATGASVAGGVLPGEAASVLGDDQFACESAS